MLEVFVIACGFEGYLCFSSGIGGGPGSFCKFVVEEMFRQDITRFDGPRDGVCSMVGKMCAFLGPALSPRIVGVDDAARGALEGGISSLSGSDIPWEIYGRPPDASFCLFRRGVAATCTL